MDQEHHPSESAARTERDLATDDEMSGVPRSASEPAYDIDLDPFIGRWNRLVSTTNWEKGRIIHEWRAALTAVNAPVTEYSDENWSRLVSSSVSGQHAGRLRRVYERFGDVYDQYQGLFWSHFQAALDWDDAEMWLEGAVQNRWSVSIMRRKRWETMGGVKEDEPQESEVVAAEVDEDFADETKTGTNRNQTEDQIVADDYMSEARSPAGPDFGDEDDQDLSALNRREDALSDATPASDTTQPTVRPFANLPELPEDLTSAFESFQLAILRHKSNDWTEVSRDDVLASLDALKTLVLAAAE